MNEQQFNASLKAAFVAPEMPAHMDHKIDAGVSKLVNRKKVRRCLTLSIGATAMIATGIFVFPAVQAQASLGGMLGALDKKTSARVMTYTIDENGNRNKVGSTIIANGNIETLDAKNRVQQVDFDNESFSYDSLANVYVRNPRRGKSGMRLSQLIGPASSFSVKKRVSIKTVTEKGREFLRATIVNGDLPERYVIEADPETQLPFHVQVESLELNRWRIRREMEFDYRDGLSVSKPDFSKTPVVTQQQKEAGFNTAMASKDLGRFKAKNSELVIRAIDVSEDGTVFVVYQCGDNVMNSWSGYQMSVDDNLNTKYFRGGQMFIKFSPSNVVPDDGKFQLEVFVPEQPIKSSNERVINVSTLVNSLGELDRDPEPDKALRGVNGTNVIYPDKHIEYKEFPRKVGKSRFVKVTSKKIAGSTCTICPLWASGIDPTAFGNEVYAEITRSGWRAKHAMDEKNWPDAERWLNETLHWMRESEVQGYSSWARDRTLNDLELVRNHLQPK